MERVNQKSADIYTLDVRGLKPYRTMGATFKKTKKNQQRRVNEDVYYGADGKARMPQRFNGNGLMISKKKSDKKLDQQVKRLKFYAAMARRKGDEKTAARYTLWADRAAQAVGNETLVRRAEKGKGSVVMLGGSLSFPKGKEMNNLNKGELREEGNNFRLAAKGGNGG